MIQDFCNYLRSIRGYSENTIRAYQKDLHSFVCWIKASRPEATWSTITRDDIDAYLTEQTKKGLAATTTNRHLSAISSLYKYMQRNGMNVENPARYESRKKTPATLPTIIPVKGIVKAYKHAQGVHKTMLGILATTGIRIQELLDLKWQDIDFETSTLTIMGKGSKERKVQTDAEVLKRLQEVSGWSTPESRVFYISQRRARYMIYEVLAPYCKCQHLNPHSIRHTFATELAKNGENCTTIAKMLGHTHIETSQKYINMAEISTSRKGICLT